MNQRLDKTEPNLSGLNRVDTLRGNKDVENIMRLRQKEIFSIFTGVEKDKIDGDLERGLVAETIRIALLLNTRGEKSLSAVSLASWVKRKIRSIVPRVTEKDFYLGVLSTNTLNLIGLGEILKVRSNEYTICSSRCVPISLEDSLLVSGLPSVCFHNKGIKMRIKGILRIINTEDANRLGIDVMGLEEFFTYHSSPMERIISSEWEEVDFLQGQDKIKNNTLSKPIKKDGWHYYLMGDETLFRMRWEPSDPRWEWVLRDGVKHIINQSYQEKKLSRDEYNVLNMEFNPPIVMEYRDGDERILRIEDNTTVNSKRELILALSIFGEYRSMNTFSLPDQTRDKFYEVIKGLGIKVSEYG